jgi:PST family polysaccharide transporter
MGVDFYPHLSGCIEQNQREGNRLVNEQAEVALLLAGPLILGTLTASDVLIRLFYSSHFLLAAGLLRWLLLGSILKIASWPLGYLIMAHGWAKASLCAELVWCSSYIGLVYLACSRYNVNSAGYAFVAAYIIYAAVVYGITHVCGAFRWTPRNLLHIGCLFFAGLSFIFLIKLNNILGYAICLIVTVVVSVLSIRRLGQVARTEARPGTLVDKIRSF